MLNDLTITYARAGSVEDGTTQEIRLECSSQVCHLGIVNYLLLGCTYFNF